MENVFFIKEAFRSCACNELKIEDEHQREMVMYRNPDGGSFFVLVTVSYDFRDPGWGVELEVGEGYPEQGLDPAEFSYSSVSLIDIDVLNAGALSLSCEIEFEEFRHLFIASLDYCLSFLSGEVQEAMAFRKKRNENAILDPLLLDSDNAHVKRQLKERNEELKRIIGKYL